MPLSGIIPQDLPLNWKTSMKDYVPPIVNKPYHQVPLKDTLVKGFNDSPEVKKEIKKFKSSRPTTAFRPKSNTRPTS